MKIVITLCLLGFSGLTGAQKLDITIIGMAHHFQEEHQNIQSFESIQDYIVSFNPDIICIESIPTWDTLSLQEIWPKAIKRADHLRDSLQSNDRDPMSSEESSKAHRLNQKALIGANYYMSHDFYNAYYYWEQVVMGGDSLGSFSSYQSSLNNSEYGLIVFPAARVLGVTEFTGIDFRAGEGDFTTNINTVLKKLLFRFKWKPLGSYLKTQKHYKRAENEGRLMQYINSDKFQKAFSTLIDELPKYLPKSEEAHQVKEYWLNRNRTMAQRIISTSREQNARRVLVTVGSAHVTHIKRYLEDQGHNVTPYGNDSDNPNN